MLNRLSICAHSVLMAGNSDLNVVFIIGASEKAALRNGGVKQ